MQVTLREAQAVADSFGVKIFVLTSFGESEVIEIYPRGPLRSKRVLYLSFWAEVRCCQICTANASMRASTQGGTAVCGKCFSPKDLQ